MVNDEEQVSALVDSELDGADTAALLGRLRGDAELARRWSRYHLISDSLHNNLPPAVPLDFAARVCAALDKEPTLLAPPRRQADLSRRVIKFGLAASVAAVAVFTVERMAGPPADGERPMLARQQPQVVDRLPQSLAARTPDPRLSPYLVNHNEYSVSSGMHGVLPYVRMVSEQAGR